MRDAHDYDKPASFYLGKKYDLVNRQVLPEKVLYEANDLTTHGMCVGMTGSGKTGLCISMLEEAALDGIPVLAVDPKGDLGNLCLTFPELRPEDFLPWIDPREAAAQGKSLEQLARETAERWRQGLAQWDISPERIRHLKNRAEVAVYTPGSNTGIPLTVLKGFAVPPRAVLEDGEIYRDRIAGTTSGLLTLLGIDADAVTSREHILISNILDHAWRRGYDLDLPELIRSIQSPPMQKVGVFDLESFFPADKRMGLAMQLNNLLASPAMAGWLEGHPLNIQELLYTPDGKPKIAILSIAHLDDTQRMSFVTLLLTELLSWMRSQTGTSSLRAMFYMDEVYGYFPPSAKPPCKPLMLTLLKQARAFGLGILLATQNPVDLDYKGLSNIGTWFLGRLQTERDKARVMEGLEGVAAQSGEEFDRSAMEATLAGLGKRVFLMNNVHDDAHTLFHTRWAMSFLSGPMSREQIQRLMEPVRTRLATAEPLASGRESEAEISDEGRGSPPTQRKSATPPRRVNRPIVPADVVEKFWQPLLSADPEAQIQYRPAVAAVASCHYVRVKAKIDLWMDRALVVPRTEPLPQPLWDAAQLVPPQALQLDENPLAGADFMEVPAELLDDRNYRRWRDELKDFLYRQMPISVYYCKELDLWSQPGQTELEARLAWSQQVRELRDSEKEKILTRYAVRVRALEKKIQTARQRLQREEAQFRQQHVSNLLNVGQTVLGALMGRRIASRAATTGRGFGRAAQQKTDVVHARESLETLQAELEELDRQCQQEIDALRDRYSIDSLTLEEVQVRCRKGDLRIPLLGLVWVPWQVDAHGNASPLVPLRGTSGGSASRG
ncbi:MAG: DUF853 family protein [Planctomycetota bacterium]|nr:MAG: DUF853 family protein [Planctomycetota bacterium]